MIDKEKLDRVNKELNEMNDHHELFKKAVNELGLNVGDIIEVIGIMGIPKRGYYKSIKIYYDIWGKCICSEIRMNKMKKDTTESKIEFGEFGPFKEIRIINHNSEE